MFKKKIFLLSETPDSFDKRTLHWVQQIRSHRDHYLYRYDEICQVASNCQNPFRWWVGTANHCSVIVIFWGALCILKIKYPCHLTVEDHKELPSAVNPELRQKEVQMNFFNQLTSVFNPDLTTILASPSALHMQVLFQEWSFPFGSHRTFPRLYYWMTTSIKDWRLNSCPLLVCPCALGLP